MKLKHLIAISAAALLFACPGCATKQKAVPRNDKIIVVASDTILSGMLASLLPPDHFSVEAILPPGQCPGHYDVKLSDVEKMEKANLVVLFGGMPFMEKADADIKHKLTVDEKGRNWMAPDGYIVGLNLLAGELSARYPKYTAQIERRKNDTIREVRDSSKALIAKFKRSGIFGSPIIASSLQKEPLEWMGFRVVGEYGRPEAMSTKEIVRLSNSGRQHKIVMVVDNIQSGPDAGKSLAEGLRVPHIAITNFPSEKGYLATMEENASALIAAAKKTQ